MSDGRLRECGPQVEIFAPVVFAAVDARQRFCGSISADAKR